MDSIVIGVAAGLMQDGLVAGDSNAGYLKDKELLQDLAVWMPVLFMKARFNSTYSSFFILPYISIHICLQLRRIAYR